MNHFIEPLESRIAPATIVNPIFDVTAAPGKTSTTIDLGTLVDPAASYRTIVRFVTNFTMPGESSPAVIDLELFDDKAPLTVANFLRYVNNANQAADYDGVIFHRLVDGFVLQGGGFNATDRNTHIQTFAEVHNEFSNPLDPELSNLEQTVAMAKVGFGVGGGPDSATSEFFFNLGDNSANLNAQNGGFTVFGRVTDASWAVVEAIAELTTKDGAPVQDYTSGTPTQSQLITITDAQIVLPSAHPHPEYQYSVKVFDQNGVDLSNLVTAKVNNTLKTLDLKYSTTAVGVAKVVVSIVDPATPGVVVTDEFNVTVKSDLIVDVTSDGLNSTFVPGQKSVAKVLVTNGGGGVAKGKVNIKLYLSETVPGTDENGQYADVAGFTADQNPTTGDRLLAELNNYNINIKAGGSVTIPVNYTVVMEALNGGQALVDGKQYRLLAVVETPSGSTVQEIYSGDANTGNFTKSNVGPTSSEVLRTFDLGFGTVAGKAGVPLTVTDANGDVLTFTMTGPGAGSVTKNVDGSINVVVSGTTAASSIKVATAKGVIADIGELEFNDAMGAISLANVHLHGNFRASGGAKSIVLGDLGNTDPLAESAEHTISIGAFPVATQKLALTLGGVHDYTFNSEMTVATFTAKEWLNDEVNTPANIIVAPAITTLKIAGDLEAGITLAGTSKLNLFSVSGTVRDVAVRTFGDVGTVQIGNLLNSQFLVGLTEQPDDIGDFVSGKTVANFTVKGTLTNSTVSAGKFTAINVAAVDGSVGSSGFYADAIKSYLRKAPGAQVKKSNLDTPDAMVDTGAGANYEVVVF